MNGFNISWWYVRPTCSLPLNRERVMDMSGTASASSLHPSNVLGSPGSTWTGGAAILGVVSQAMSNGLPTTQSGWAAFVGALCLGVGGIFSKA